MISATSTLRAMRNSEDPGTRLAAQFVADAFEAFSNGTHGGHTDRATLDAVARHLRQASNFALDAADPQYVHVAIVESTPRRSRAS